MFLSVCGSTLTAAPFSCIYRSTRPLSEKKERLCTRVCTVFLCAGLHVTMSFFVQHACHFLLRLVPPCVLIAAHPNVFNALINLMATKREHCERERLDGPSRICCLKIAGCLFCSARGCLTQLFLPTRDFQRPVCC